MNCMALERINIFKISNMVFTLLMFFVMCLDSVRDVEAGGKGKGNRQGHIIIQNELKGNHHQVPIYMPIPIPIPMPMGPPGGGGKYHHHHHHQQQHRDDDGGGEVKKIYLLQPAPRMQPQPHLKGGGFMGGPVQTHIHMTPSAIGRHNINNNNNNNNNHHQQQISHEGDQSEQPGGGKHRSKSSSHSHDSMKILPIVVIPPIAPMPPIQLPSSNSIQGARMTLTPQFNNYLVTPASTDLGDKSGRHRITLLQDHKSFSDYGLGSGGGGSSGSHYRDNYGARSRLRGRQALRSALSDYDGTGSSRVRYSRSQDELGDDYDIPSTWRMSQRHPSNRLAASRRIALLNNASRLRANSIRDILDQQALFDDEPSSVIDELRDTINDARLTSGTSSTTCCGALDERHQTRYNEVPTSADNIYAADTNLDQREPPADINLNSYHRQSSASSKVRQYDSLAPSLIERAIQDEESDKPAVFRQKDSLYYDKDPLDLPTGGRLAASSYRYIHQPTADSFTSSSNNKRLHSDERDLLDDYEWRFDSIKSVAHASPQVVRLNGTDISSSKNMTLLSRDAS